MAPHPRSTFLPSPVSPSAVCKKEYPSPVDPEENTLSSSPVFYALQQRGNRSRGSSPDRSSGSGTTITTMEASHNPPHGTGGGPPTGIARRLARSDRLDTKRYYTAGVIEDIKVKPTG